MEYGSDDFFGFNELAEEVVPVYEELLCVAPIIISRPAINRSGIRVSEVDVKFVLYTVMMTGRGWAGRPSSYSEHLGMRKGLAFM